MSFSRQQFDDRVADLKALLKLTADLERQISRGSPTEVKLATPPVDTSALAVLKASVFIVVYNMVESTIRGAFEWLYREMEGSGASYIGLRDEVRKLWVRQEFFGGIDMHSASPRTYFERVGTVVELISQANVPKLRGSDLQVSGNLDAAAIRKVCEKHGVRISVPASVKGGAALSVIREHRNNLAHGVTTFSECGRQYTVADLKRSALEAERYLRSVLRHIERYASRFQYATTVERKAQRQRIRGANLASGTARPV